MNAAERALEYIHDGSVVGLGTGRAATAFIRALGGRVQDGLKVRGVPTSRTSAELARQLGIPLTSLEEVEAIDVDVDGADEVDPHLNLIKGRGGALVREKVVAAASRLFVVVVTGRDKLVDQLGSHGDLPIEVIPFALSFCRRRLAEFGCKPRPRTNPDGSLFVTDNQNHILDCMIDPIPDPEGLELAIRSIPGVVGTGLFLGMAHAVLIEDGGAVEVRERHPL
ncbi:MAG: ribose-5-phosphate isomerase RpiA [Isosphaeraceae bacterium]|nr:ribose-5-phosphate isomerase RpiA [Isosphaeraceae bacterium]